MAAAVAIAEAPEAAEPPAVGHADAEELGAILDTTAEGIVMFDAEGNVNSANRSAEALFDMTAPSWCSAISPICSRRRASTRCSTILPASNPAASRACSITASTLGRVAQGGLILLAMTMGRTRADGPNFFAVFRDSRRQNTESELREARRLTDRAATAKSDVLARISHEVRTPLNAIIGFAEAMIGERFRPRSATSVMPST